MNFVPSAEQTQMIDSVSRLVRGRLDVILGREPKTHAIPKAALLEAFALVADYGLLAPRLPQEAGGPGISMLDYGMMFERIPPALSMSMLSQDSLIARLYGEGTPEHHRRFLPDLVSGKKIGCTGSTEPETGSDPRGIKTRLRREGDWAVVSGRKMWVTNISVCDTILVTCIDESRQDGKSKVVKIIIDRAESPFEAREIDAIGLNQGFLGEAVFDECRVPISQIIDAESGTKSLNKSWNVNRPLVGLQAVHLAQKAFDQALEYSKIRRQFGKPIAAHQLVQKNLSDMATAITASRLLCYQALSFLDQGLEADGASAMAKRFAQMQCRDVIWQAMNIMGAMGLSREAGLEQLYRDARMLPIPDGTNEILALIHGRELTGFEAFRGLAVMSGDQRQKPAPARPAAPAA
jgi:alkylation response protein AidB-like acyl-CoA dehydrogenase